MLTTARVACSAPFGLEVVENLGLMVTALTTVIAGAVPMVGYGRAHCSYTADDVRSSSHLPSSGKE